VNRYGAAAAAIGLLLTAASCGGGNDRAEAASDTPIIPTTPVAATTATPTADPTAAAKAKVLADYSRFFAVNQKGLRDGGVSYPYEQIMVEPALGAAKRYQAYVKGVRGARVSGSSKLLEARISASDLFGKQPTATVIACAMDNLKAVDKFGKVLASPPGKISRLDKFKLVKGRWMAYSTEAGDPSIGCLQ
jgi:hypothetical protein